MDENRAVELLKKALGCLQTDPKDCASKKCSMCKHNATKEDGIEAISMAIKALEKAPTALDHIHNVVSEREYQRGYEQGKKDAEKEMHDNILRYRMPEPWEGETDGKID